MTTTTATVHQVTPALGASSARSTDTRAEKHTISTAAKGATLHPNLAEASLRIDAIGVQLAVRADVPYLLAHEASGVRESPALVLRLRAHPKRVLRRAAVEADAHLGLLGHNSNRHRKRSSRFGTEGD